MTMRSFLKTRGSIFIIIFLFAVASIGSFAIASSSTKSPDGDSDVNLATYPLFTANYQAVQNSDSSYVYTNSTSYVKDLYTLSSIDLRSGTEINSVAVNTSVKMRCSLVYGYSKAIIKTNGTEYSSTTERSFVNDSAYHNYSEVFAVNPVTGNKWTINEANNLIAGVALKKGSGLCIYAVSSDRVYVDVNYSRAQIQQNYYRFYEDNGSSTPTVALAAENTAISGLGAGDRARLRMQLKANNGPIATGAQFKLQYGAVYSSSTCSTIGSWQDVDEASSSSSAWRFYNNASISNGLTLPSTLLTDSDVAETYQEANNTALTPRYVASSSDAEWDFNIENYSATSTATYCFRMAETDDASFPYYSYYPRITTE
jgi:hypothetical protein